ncbi:TRAF-type zinc finger domain-containing protein 1 isoform X3 [Canis lupus baileyi]|uniref:TRAF-type zinc finger domain-containing protein 1 isoform X2 n=1 Tax=Canis lupus familiaris TaxID=9615 RepID=UPI000BA9FCB4|nr:TRAF-type zinc finger domain-containing protein 1 isoform X2 [Canis lupus familiaris]XP_025329790.1 TRAF-type zinc finger domain-containing protein 1 isoform X3 [Canis lupus dingo]XP_038292654.1 TRAF-type zinc finger domain-containing protein 1 isoform X2 [Canis lupus familiaris]XP_038431063.1 TRAF-type zinc finger domain-containing protein 1 isoform X2 [Canis lupus familiaris]|eukprot:XP_022265960.1 TRAF-type zinc finger domain-containing protein 1 isoform X2 [Canis lupus familiaris]
MAEFLDDQDTQLCDNCKKEIPVFNFTIHEIHCQRNIGMCPVCKEPFPKSDMESHMATEHCQVTCKCNKKLEKRQLKKHEETECPLRLALCQHCDLELSVLKLKDHEDYCGARTELCGSCGRNVLVKDLKTHPEVCGRFGEEKKDEVAVPPNAYDESWGQDGIWIASQLLRQIEALDPPMRIPRRPMRAFESDLFHSRTTNQRNMTAQFPIQNNLCAADRTMLPCEFCEELYPEELLIDHQTSCNPSCALPSLNMGSTSPRGVEDPDVIFQKFLQQAANNQLDSLMGLSSSPPVKDSIIIPCEFCGVQLEEEVLFHHQDQCDQRPATANNHVTEGIPRQDFQPPETSPDLPKRRVRHQGDLSSGYMDDIKQETAKGPTYPLPPSRPINNMTATYNRLSTSTSGPRPGCQPSPPRILKLNNLDSQDSRGRNRNSHNAAMVTGHVPVIHPGRNLYPENLVPSFPRAPSGRYGVSGRNEGGRNSRVTSTTANYRNRTAKAKPPKQQGAGDAEEEEEEE